MDQNHEAGTVEPDTAERDDRPGEGQAGAPTPEAQLEAAHAEVASLREQHLRTAAELENVRRRAMRDVENAHRYGIERFAADVLGVVDSMELGLQSMATEQPDGPVAEGFRATLKLLGQSLERFGITPIDPLGEPFNPELHEAMTTQPAPGKTPGTVLTVVQKGYRIHDRLLRPARVIVVRAEEPSQS